MTAPEAAASATTTTTTTTTPQPPVAPTTPVAPTQAQPATTAATTEQPQQPAADTTPAPQTGYVEKTGAWYYVNADQSYAKGLTTIAVQVTCNTLIPLAAKQKAPTSQKTARLTILTLTRVTPWLACNTLPVKQWLSTPKVNKSSATFTRPLTAKLITLVPTVKRQSVSQVSLVTIIISTLRVNWRKAMLAKLTAKCGHLMPQQVKKCQQPRHKSRKVWLLKMTTTRPTTPCIAPPVQTSITLMVIWRHHLGIVQPTFCAMVISGKLQQPRICDQFCRFGGLISKPKSTTWTTCHNLALSKTQRLIPFKMIKSPWTRPVKRCNKPLKQRLVWQIAQTGWRRWWQTSSQHNHNGTKRVKIQTAIICKRVPWRLWTAPSHQIQILHSAYSTVPQRIKRIHKIIRLIIQRAATNCCWLTTWITQTPSCKLNNWIGCTTWWILAQLPPTMLTRTLMVFVSTPSITSMPTCYKLQLSTSKRLMVWTKTTRQQTSICQSWKIGVTMIPFTSMTLGTTNWQWTITPIRNWFGH